MGMVEGVAREPLPRGILSLKQGARVTAPRTAIDDVYAQILARNPGEFEFHQAVREVFGSLDRVLERNPHYVQASILERICEPERQIIFRVPWVDDAMLALGVI